MPNAMLRCRLSKHEAADLYQNLGRRTKVQMGSRLLHSQVMFRFFGRTLLGRHTLAVDK
jgi:hypothetical protein